MQPKEAARAEFNQRVLKVFLFLDPCGMRKSFNGLHTHASDELQTAAPACSLRLYQQTQQPPHHSIPSDSSTEILYSEPVR